jgi:hypothetical protein
MRRLFLKPSLPTLVACCMYALTNAQTPNNNSGGNEFEKLKGKLTWPVDNIKEIITYQQRLENRRNCYHCCAPTPSLTIKSDSPTTVKASAEGQVRAAFDVEGVWSVMIKSGNYFMVYTNLNKVLVKKGDTVQQNQPIGQINIPNDENLFELELMLMKLRKNFDPYEWFKPLEKAEFL